MLEMSRSRGRTASARDRVVSGGGRGGAEEEVGGALGDLGTASGEDVAIDVEGDAGVGVAEAFGHVGDRDPSGNW